MNDVLFCKWHRLTPKKKIRNSPDNRGQARVIFLHRPYNKMSHLHSWCNRHPVGSIGGAPDC